jgi:hypothetical protein
MVKPCQWPPFDIERLVRDWAACLYHFFQASGACSFQTNVGVMRRVERLYRVALRQSASFMFAPNQRSQRSLREVSNPPIPAVQISLQALSESMQFLWRLDARGIIDLKRSSLAAYGIPIDPQWPRTASSA